MRLRSTVKLGAKKIELSSIFKWFRTDFDTFAPGAFGAYPRKIRGTLAFFSRYLDAKTATAIRADEFDYDYGSYDWSLNDRKIKPAKIVK